VKGIVRALALLIAALTGGVLGFFVGRGTVSNSEALTALSQALAIQHRVSAAAPIIATGLTATSAIIGATLCVAVVWAVILKTEGGRT